MTTSSQAPGTAYNSCVDEVLRQSPFLIDRWCSKLLHSMNEQFMLIDDSAERNKFQYAIAAFKKSRLLITQGFVGELRSVIAEAAVAGAIKKSVSPVRSLSAVSFDQLELMGDNQIQETVESARLQQIIKSACEAGLADFSARLSTAQGFSVVKSDVNSLRPEILARGFLRLLQALPVTRQARALWLLDGARIMGEELQSLYVTLNDLLSAQGFAPAAYGVIVTPETQSEKALLQAAPDGVQVSPVSVSDQEIDPGTLAAKNESTKNVPRQLLTLDHLHHLVTGHYDQTDNEPSPDEETEEVFHQEFLNTLPGAGEILTESDEEESLTAGAKPAEPVMPQSLEPSQPDAGTDANSMGQSLAVEVVGLMIEQMVNDVRLLPQVRQVIANIEPAFLRLALTDSRFFSEKSHPARRLLQSITGTSLGYASEDAPGFSEFLQSLQEVAALLTPEYPGDAQHFKRLLHTFERRQSRNTPDNRQAQSRAVQVLLQAEQRNLMAVKLAAEIRARPDFVEVNRIITAFVTGPWAQVMANERLLGEFGASSSAPPVFSLTLGDVLWSLDIAKTARHRKRLLKIIPDMLQSLREGLMSIDFPLDQSRPFFDELMAIHQAALKGQPSLPASSSQNRRTLEKIFETDDQADVAQLWLAPTEVQHSGFLEDWDGPSSASPGATPLKPQDSSSPAAPALPEVGDRAELSLGGWVDMLVDMQWLRAQLTWISPHNTLFMFTSEGGRKHSMTSRVVHHLLELDLIKVVSQQCVVDGALDGVARAALHNSVQKEGNF